MEPTPPSQDEPPIFYLFFFVCVFIILSFYHLPLSTFQDFDSVINTASQAGQINLHHFHQIKERRNVDATSI